MTTVFAHGGPFYSWEDWEAHRKECPECRPEWELERRALRRVAELLWSHGLPTRDGMPADPKRFGLITLTSRLENEKGAEAP